ncbi:MAG: tRNA (adenosine(37)-N6)-threonylcarbamoyltransferase complex ATPase subunit type 1 TsaE [Clostridia bacterium]|nr:tRNA (adenosine(37)-N6)-threonylcarbamoyltransferase complex ATPase subunit type 1 TsaE [Clostridia bacterium]
MIHIAYSEEDTRKIASEFAKTLKIGDVILLNGDLGAGKTTFTRFVLQARGVQDIINSPTFSILKSYKGDMVFHHFDTYRISTDEAIEAGFDEILDDKDSVILIEWSENIAPLLPSKRIVINIRLVGDNTREIEIINE